MVRKYGKVLVLMGGWSNEREISLISGKSVLDSLISSGVDAHELILDKKNIFVARSDYDMTKELLDLINKN